MNPARWPNGPRICATANLPAFASLVEWRNFHSANGPSCKIIREYQCTDCGQWHAVTTAPDPAGASSGQGRSSK